MKTQGHFLNSLTLLLSHFSLFLRNITPAYWRLFELIGTTGPKRVPYYAKHILSVFPNNNIYFVHFPKLRIVGTSFFQANPSFRTCSSENRVHVMSQWAQRHRLVVASTFAEGLTKAPIANRKLKSKFFFQKAGNKGLNTKVSGEPQTIIVRLISTYKDEHIVKSLNKWKETKLWILKDIVLCKFFFFVITEETFESLKNQVMHAAWPCLLALLIRHQGDKNDVIMSTVHDWWLTKQSITPLFRQLCHS